MLFLTYRDVFADVSFGPTGGVMIETGQSYVRMANVVVVDGSWCLPRESIEHRDWATIARSDALSVETARATQ